MRKLELVAAIVVLAAGSISSTASATDVVKHTDLIYCAAVNLVVARGLSGLDAKARFEDKIKLLHSQASALILIAAGGKDEDPVALAEETSKQADILIWALADKAKGQAQGQAFFGTEVPRCVSMGQAADKEITASTAGK